MIVIPYIVCVSQTRHTKYRVVQSLCCEELNIPIEQEGKIEPSGSVVAIRKKPVPCQAHFLTPEIGDMPYLVTCTG